MLIPYHRAVIDSPLSVFDIEEALEEHVDTRPIADALVKGYDKRRPFKGSVSTDGFSLWCMQYRMRSQGRLIVQNSFMPVIRGRLETLDEGTRVTISWRLRVISMVTMGAFFLFCLLAGATIGSDVVAGTAELRPIMLVIPAVFAAGWAMMSWGFWSHVRRTEKILRRILEKKAYM
jgi:hypothetical protein